MHILYVPLSDGAIEASRYHRIRIKGVNLYSLYLLRVSDFIDEERALSPYIELEDLPIFKLYKVYLIVHSLYVGDALAGHFDYFFALWTSCVVHTQNSSLRRAYEEVPRDRINPYCTTKRIGRNYKLHLYTVLLYSKK